MTEGDHHTVLSVRGEAQRSIDPDQASIHCAATTIAAAKDAALAEVSAALDAATAALARLGGRTLTVESSRAPLTWSTHSLHTNPEHDLDKATGQHGPTGRHHASGQLVVAIRDFGLLGRVEAALTAQPLLEIHGVGWSVDYDNPGWALVRADAIDAALRQGTDYANALGGSVVSVDQVADAGLLAGEATGPVAVRARKSVAMSTRGNGDSQSLDPAPQEISAVIEARLTAMTAALPTARDR